MALTKEQSISQYGTEAYTGWPELEAANDAAAHPEKLNSYYSTPSVSVDDYIQTIQDTLPAPPEEYLKANPFYFDEQAAREVSTAEFAPYYQEILSDYMGDVKMVADKNQGDYNRILTDLEKQKELFLSQNQQDFDKLIRGIKEGYSSKGLYFSGTNARTQAEAGGENTNKIESYLNTYGSKTGQAGDEFKFSQQQQNVDMARKQRDIGRDQNASILGGVQTQKNEALDEYLYGMQTYYKNPNWKSLNPEVGNTLQKQGVQI
jgi:hypothetical protein